MRMTTLGELVRKATGNRTQYAFAKEIGISPEQLSRIINGTTMLPKPETISAIANHSEGRVTLEELNNAAGIYDPQRFAKVETPYENEAMATMVSVFDKIIDGIEDMIRPSDVYDNAEHFIETVMFFNSELTCKISQQDEREVKDVDKTYYQKAIRLICKVNGITGFLTFILRYHKTKEDKILPFKAVFDPKTLMEQKALSYNTFMKHPSKDDIKRINCQLNTPRSIIFHANASRTPEENLLNAILSYKQEDPLYKLAVGEGFAVKDFPLYDKKAIALRDKFIEKHPFDMEDYSKRHYLDPDAESNDDELIWYKLANALEQATGHYFCYYKNEIDSDDNHSCIMVEHECLPDRDSKEFHEFMDVLYDICNMFNIPKFGMQEFQFESPREINATFETDEYIRRTEKEKFTIE